MLVLGVEPSLTAYKTIVRTDTLYELLMLASLILSFNILFAVRCYYILNI